MILNENVFNLDAPVNNVNSILKRCYFNKALNELIIKNVLNDFMDDLIVKLDSDRIYFLPLVTKQIYLKWDISKSRYLLADKDTNNAQVGYKACILLLYKNRIILGKFILNNSLKSIIIEGNKAAQHNINSNGKYIVLLSILFKPLEDRINVYIPEVKLNKFNKDHYISRTIEQYQLPISIDDISNIFESETYL